MDDNTVNRNSYYFIGLAAEFCSTLEQAREQEKETFVASMLKLLPRLYISMSDVEPGQLDYEPMGSYVDEAQYEQVRAGVAALLGEDDTYLDTFEQDMKYSDSPIAAHISEGLADIYQDLANCVAPVRDSEGALTEQALQECRENFAEYWAQTLVNVLRPLNALHYNPIP